MAFSLDDKHIIVNYHYVENPNKENSGMHPCGVAEFEEQVKFLSEHYESMSLPDVFKYVKENSDKRTYSITFDDGLKDQYKNAAPILKKYGTHATFFVITGTLEGLIPYTHRLHVLLSLFSPLEVMKEWNVFTEGSDAVYIPAERRLFPDRRLYEEIPSANIKEMFSRVAPKNLRDSFITAFFKKNDLFEKDLSRKLFMSDAQIKDLANEPLFTVGDHTHSHEVLIGSGVSEEKVRDDIRKSIKWFEKLGLPRPKIFSYPHGIVGGSDILQEEGFSYAVIAGDERAVGANDDPLSIPRYEASSVRSFLQANNL